MEDDKVFLEGERFENFVKGSDWAWIKDRFTQRIMDLQSIKNLEGSAPDEIMSDIKARNTAVDILMEIIRDVEGRADQHQNNKLPKITTEEIYVHIN